MKKLFALVLLALSGFASAAEPVTLDVRWIRAHSTVSEVRDGVCVLYMADHESGLEVGASQLEQCMSKGGLMLPDVVPTGAKRVHVYRVTTWDAEVQLFQSMYGHPLTGDDVNGYPGGFYHAEPDGTCSIVYRAKASLIGVGHELKHCFDGNFHDAAHKWITTGEAPQGPVINLWQFGPSATQRAKWASRHGSD